MASSGPGRGGIGRRLALLAYKIFRPVVRPVAWRVRSFLVGDLRRELGEISARLDAMEGGRQGLSPALERLALTLLLEADAGPRGTHDFQKPEGVDSVGATGCAGGPA